jgi:hypothetical protein
MCDWVGCLWPGINILPALGLETYYFLSPVYYCIFTKALVKLVALLLSFRNAELTPAAWSLLSYFAILPFIILWKAWFENAV